MTFYKFTARHGPGHQSSSEDYVYISDEMKEALKAEETRLDDYVLSLWKHWVEDEHLDYPIGNAEIVTEMPAKLRDGLIAESQDVVKDELEKQSYLSAIPTTNEEYPHGTKGANDALD